MLFDMIIKRELGIVVPLFMCRKHNETARKILMSVLCGGINFYNVMPFICGRQLSLTKKVYTGMINQFSIDFFDNYKTQ